MQAAPWDWYWFFSAVAWAFVAFTGGFLLGRRRRAAPAKDQVSTIIPAEQPAEVVPAPVKKARLQIETDLEILEIYDDATPLGNEAQQLFASPEAADNLRERTAKVRKRSTGEVRLIRLVVPR